MEIIETYLHRLHDDLVKFGISKQYANEIIESIQVRIYSIVFHWNDISFRKGILAVGLEEGKFYEPLIGDLDVKSFVVIAIRNSLIEIPQSDDYTVAGLDKQLDSEFVKHITREAINSFSKFNFEEASSICKNPKTKDYYQNIIIKYPIAWGVLKILGNNDKNIIQLAPKKQNNPINLLDSISDVMQFQNEKAISLTQIVENGMDPNISKALKNMLVLLDKNQVESFYVDSFKMATRNFEKLMYIIEFVLSRNKVFCTNNYYITKDYIEKRIPIIRPAHTTNDFHENIKNLAGTSKRHKNYLQSIVF